MPVTHGVTGSSPVRTAESPKEQTLGLFLYHTDAVCAGGMLVTL